MRTLRRVDERDGGKKDGGKRDIGEGEDEEEASTGCEYD